jgi:hypothetical protein
LAAAMITGFSWNSMLLSAITSCAPLSTSKPRMLKLWGGYCITTYCPTMPFHKSSCHFQTGIPSEAPCSPNGGSSSSPSKASTRVPSGIPGGMPIGSLICAPVSSLRMKAQAPTHTLPPCHWEQRLIVYGPLNIKIILSS